ncbi:14372_t:CDS:2, partial [Dentiscutata heterogama]
MAPALAKFQPYIGQEPPDEYLDKVIQSWAYFEEHMIVLENANAGDFNDALEDEVRELRNQITHKDISFNNIKAQKELIEMDSFKCKLELENAELSTKNIYLDLKKKDLEDILAKKKDELAQMKDNLVTTQRALIEKDTLLQEA